MRQFNWGRGLATQLLRSLSTSSSEVAGDKQSNAAVSDKGVAPGKTAGAAASPVKSVYAESLAQWKTAVNWLIVALGAVATAMIAGSQLSSIGELSADAQRDRLFLAVGGLAVAIGFVLLSIGLLFWAQSPANTDFSRLGELAGGASSSALAKQVLDQVEADTSFNRGTGSLAGLWTALWRVRTEYYGLYKYRDQLARELAHEKTEAARRRLQANLTRLDDELEVVREQLKEYRTGLQLVANLDAFLRTRQRFRIASVAVLILSFFATCGFVVFAWAANPPMDATEAAPQRPVDATLKLTSEGQEALTDQLGTVCATAASTDGIRVIALSSSEKGIEAVVVSTADCPEPVKLVVSSGNGNVTANRQVTP